MTKIKSMKGMTITNDDISRKRRLLGTLYRNTARNMATVGQVLSQNYSSGITTV